MNNRLSLVLILFFITLSPLCAQRFPEIKELDSRNPVFRQYQEDVTEANRNMAKGLPLTMTIYVYTAHSSDTVFTVSSRCSITYDTLVTLNSISDSKESLTGKKLYLPSANGIFIPETPETTMEILLSREYEEILENCSTIILNKKKYYFLQDRRLTPVDRAFFLDSEIRLPLEESVLTSPYGMRISPISGGWKFHHGIDMSAPENTDIFCVKNGHVKKCGYDETYGYSITIDHGNGLKSFYAHLKKILVKEGDPVKRGTVIGKTGSTGLATGPHLHFELLVHGKSADPENFYE